MSTTPKPALHPATADLVARFFAALSEKLAAAEKKYGYSDGWASPDWMDECRAKLMEHIAKGDPRDVAAYCAFLWHHGASTAQAEPAAAAAQEDDRADAIRFRWLCEHPDWHFIERLCREFVADSSMEFLVELRRVIDTRRSVKLGPFEEHASAQSTRGPR